MLYVKMLFLFVAGHFICDVILQSINVSKNKNPFVELPEGFNQTTWPYFLLAHAFTHSIAVLVITNSYTLAVAELGLHCFIDYNKCVGNFGKNYHMHIDQGLHLFCKLIYLVAVAQMGYGSV